VLAFILSLFLFLFIHLTIINPNNLYFFHHSTLPNISGNLTFPINITTATTLAVSTCGSSFDTMLDLRDSSFKILESVDDGPDCASNGALASIRVAVPAVSHSPSHPALK
jgi:hypothetical protein